MQFMFLILFVSFNPRIILSPILCSKNDSVKEKILHVAWPPNIHKRIIFPSHSAHTRRKIFNYSLYSMWVEKEKKFIHHHRHHPTSHSKKTFTRRRGKNENHPSPSHFPFSSFSLLVKLENLLYRAEEMDTSHIHTYADVYFTHIFYVLSDMCSSSPSLSLTQLLLLLLLMSWFCIHLKYIYILLVSHQITTRRRKLMRCLCTLYLCCTQLC